MDTGIFFHRGPIGWKGTRILGTSKEEWRRVLEMGHLSPRELHEGNLEGGLLYWEPQRIC
jgi:hypothetical protein